MAYGMSGMQSPGLWQELLRRLDQQGVAIDPSQSGGFADRNIAGTNIPSKHAARDALGRPAARAYDVNYNDNPQGQLNPNTVAMPYDMYGEHARIPSTSIHPEVGRDVAAGLGLEWGGNWDKRDQHHFEMPGRTGDVPFTRAALMGPESAPMGGTTSPITTGSVASAAPQGGGMAPATAGGGLMNYIQGLGTNPLFLGGLTMLAGQGPAAGAQIANTALTQRRAETLFQQQQAEYNKRQQIWGDAFPNGQPNTAHTLLKGVPVPLAQTIYSMGPEAGLPELAKYQLADATARAAIERRWEEYQKFDTGASPAAPQTAQVAPPAAAPGAAPAPNLAAPAPIAGIGLAPANPITPETYAPPPALAPPVGAPGAPTRAAAEPTVMTPFGQRTLSQAVQMAERMHAAGLPNDPTLEAAITAARAPQQAGLTKQAEMDVAQQQAKPQARSKLSGMVDALDRQTALTTKLIDDPNLRDATGNNASPRYDPQAAKFWGTDTPIRYFSQSWPGSPKRRIENDMLTLVNKVGLDTLQTLKAETASGASGLGSTSEREITMLENSLTALKDPSIPYEDYKANLRIVQQVTENVRARLLGQWKETYGEDFKHAPGQQSSYPTKPATPEKTYEINVAGKKRKYIMGPSGPEWAN